MTTNNDKINLTASHACKICRGSGWVQESHGEVLDCECAFEGAPNTPEAQEAIDAGRFTVSPAPEYIAAMEAFNRACEEQEAADYRAYWEMRAAEAAESNAESNPDAWIDNALHSACEGDCGDME